MLVWWCSQPIKLEHRRAGQLETELGALLWKPISAKDRSMRSIPPGPSLYHVLIFIARWRFHSKINGCLKSSFSMLNSNSKSFDAKCRKIKTCKFYILYIIYSMLTVLWYHSLFSANCVAIVDPKWRPIVSLQSNILIRTEALKSRPLLTNG